MFNEKDFALFVFEKMKREEKYNGDNFEKFYHNDFEFLKEAGRLEEYYKAYEELQVNKNEAKTPTMIVVGDTKDSKNELITEDVKKENYSLEQSLFWLAEFFKEKGANAYQNLMKIIKNPYRLELFIESFSEEKEAENE
jgi:hypothetical protein